MNPWPFLQAPPEPAHYGNKRTCGPHKLAVPDPNDPGRCFYCLELLPAGGTPGS